MDFNLKHSGNYVKQLQPENTETMQKLYEEGIDFAYFTEGKPPSPTAASEEFLSVPEGKTTQDKYMFGLFNSNHVLLGMIESIRHYPDDETWWLGLMMLAPKQRQKGLGTDFYQAFERWVILHRVQYISLAVIVENLTGLNFWKKMGFEIIRETPPKSFGNKTHTLYVMRKTLKKFN